LKQPSQMTLRRGDDREPRVVARWRLWTGRLAAVRFRWSRLAASL
jgi:hypothetical protein